MTARAGPCYTTRAAGRVQTLPPSSSVAYPLSATAGGAPRPRRVADDVSAVRRVNRRRGSVVSAAAFLAALAAATGAGRDAAWAAPTEIFPSTSLFRPLLADPREAQSSLRYLVSSGKARGQAAFGDTFGLVRINTAFPVQFGLQGSVFTRFNRDADSAGFLDINSADYTLFLPLDVQFGGWVLRTGVGHLSSHFGESEVQRQILSGGALSFDRRFLYRRDYVRVTAAWDATEQLRLYGGASVAVHVRPSAPRTTIQTGAEWRWALHPLGSIMRQWYLGVDFQSWAESDWAANANLEGGLRLARPDGTRGVRISLSGYAGRSLQRVLASERERYLSAGLIFEF